MRSATPELQIDFWAALPPPIGGATRSNAAIAEALANDYGDVVTVSRLNRSPVRLMYRLATALLRRRELLIIAASGPNRIPYLWPLFLNKRHQRIIFLIHGTHGIDEWARSKVTISACLATRILRRHSVTVWVNNAEATHEFRRRGIDAEVVSPWLTHSPTFCSNRVEPRSVSTDAAKLIVTAEANNSPTYCLDAVVQACDELRARGESVRLAILRYGSRAFEKDMPTWVEQHVNMRPSEVAGLLKRASLLVRATLTDGDSGLVREALAAGCPVLASDVVPRPAGVGLFNLDCDSMPDAILGVERVSDGLGVGTAFDERLRDVIEAWK